MIGCTRKKQSAPYGKASWIWYLKAAPSPPAIDAKKIPELVDKACVLFPLGIPQNGHRWVRSANCTDSDYAEFCRSVMWKTLQCPISSRWYTVEKGAAYLYLHDCLSLTRATIFPGFDMAFWPGDQINAEEDQAQYKERKKKRAEKVLAFISSENFVPGLVYAVATCKPRWTFARNINPRQHEEGKKIRGITHALSTILQDYRAVFNCTDICSNYVVDRLPRAGFHRLGVVAAIFRSLSYT